MTPPRRAAFLALAGGTIAVGLVLRQLRGTLPHVAADILGDVLWAAMIAWLVGGVAPTMRRTTRGAFALVICWSVEFGQLYHGAPFAAWRDTTLGHLVLGSDFDPRDLVAYALGVLAALRLEPRLAAGRGR